MNKKNITTSLQLVALITLLSIAYEFAVLRSVTFTYMFNVNFWIGVVILIGGLTTLITPTFILFKKNKLIDHTTYGQRLNEEREDKRPQSYSLIYIGIFNISITATFQLIAWLVF